jgi:hypothetical protein
VCVCVSIYIYISLTYSFTHSAKNAGDCKRHAEERERMLLTYADVC